MNCSEFSKVTPANSLNRYIENKNLSFNCSVKKVPRSRAEACIDVIWDKFLRGSSSTLAAADYAYRSVYLYR